MRRSCRYSPFWEVRYHAEKAVKEKCVSADAGLYGISSDIDPVCDTDVFFSPAGIFRGSEGRVGLVVYDALYNYFHQYCHCTDPGKTGELYHGVYIQEKEPGVRNLHDAGN